MTTKTQEITDEMIEIIRNNKNLSELLEQRIYDHDPEYVESNTEVLLYILRTAITSDNDQLRNLHLLDEVVCNITEMFYIHELVLDAVHDVFDDVINTLISMIFTWNK